MAYLDFGVEIEEGDVVLWYGQVLVGDKVILHGPLDAMVLQEMPGREECWFIETTQGGFRFWARPEELRKMEFD